MSLMKKTIVPDAIVDALDALSKYELISCKIGGLKPSWKSVTALSANDSTKINSGYIQ